ncbi:hypothetical protein [Bacillus vallismortis]|uniref:hypothetical protein n=1 Tax=Bacillus vallismortis TaxID=72361 RepID=UPI00227DD58F|nr:hypothetical protein [Bacillus vallismortis]MCY8532616.1 hypothetical protein [Bacillus vallismortis]MCY8548118.1 hypothetical protein [Bacillus vallismortis]
MSAISYLKNSMTKHKTIYQKKVESLVKNDLFFHEKSIEKSKIMKNENVRKQLTKGYMKLLSEYKED